MHRVYPATRGPGSVLSHFVVSAVGPPGHPGAAAAAKLGEAGSTLLAGTLLDDGDLAAADAADDMRAHVVRFVRAHLDDPRLSRAGIAAAHFSRVFRQTTATRRHRRGRARAASVPDSQDHV